MRAWRSALAACAGGLLLACGGGSDGDDGPPAGGGPPPPVAAGPPEPVIVDESGVPAAADASRLAVIGVAVVPMDRETVVENQTVLIEDGVITAVGDAALVAVPADAVRLEGADRYLMPGLIDMHAHLLTEPGAEQDLLLELAAGVTTVRIMWGFQRHLDWRAEIADGARTGPSLFVASAGLEGEGPYWPGSIVVTTDGEARAAVREAHGAGYDFIKVYNRLEQGPYVEILDEAAMLGVPVVGHVPTALTATFAIESGQQTIEHFSRFAPEVTTTGNWTGAIDRSRLEALIARLQLARTWNCPTLTVQLRSQSQVAGIKASPLYALVSGPMRAWLASSLTQPGGGDRSTEDGRRKEVLAAFIEAGVGVVVGTDTGVQYVLPGFSIHEELRHFAAAGLTPYQVLRAATADAAAALGSEDRGTITAGRRADFLLLDADPLADVAHVNRRVGVMAGGRWFSQSRLMELARNGANP